MPDTVTMKIEEQRVEELVKRCEQDLKSVSADLHEGARERVAGKCAALLTDARNLEKAARRL
jgi:hypothetical protein